MTMNDQYELSANYHRIKVKFVLAKISKSKSVQGGGGWRELQGSNLVCKIECD